jgi:hypothetical protein
MHEPRKEISVCEIKEWDVWRLTRLVGYLSKLGGRRRMEFGCQASSSALSTPHHNNKGDIFRFFRDNSSRSIFVA